MNVIYEGMRNNYMHKFAVEKLKLYGAEDGQAEELFYQEAQKCVPLLGDRELAKTFKSALKFYNGTIKTQADYIPPEVYNKNFLTNAKGIAKKIKTPRLSIALLEQHLETSGIDLKYNDITHENEIRGISQHISNENIEDLLATIIYDNIVGNFTGCSMQNITNFLKVIYAGRHYNPVIDILNNITWDSKSRISELYEIMNIKDELSKTLVKKWLMQCVSMLHNGEIGEPFGSDGVLVLVGEQGIGKTSLFRKLALGYFREGAHIDFKDKDTIRRATSCFICELGEIESTFRSDVEGLKALITMGRDDYRLPYAKADVKIPRRATMCGTCNSDEFLIDQTGNRRYWTVPVDNIDLDKLKDFDVKQLWAEIVLEVERQGLQAFRLTKEEQRQLAQRNGKHEKPIKAEVEVGDILSIGKNENYPTAYITVTEFKESYSKHLYKYSASQIGKALARCGVEKENKRMGNKPFPVSCVCVPVPPNGLQDKHRL